MTDDQKDAILTEIEKRHDILAAICREDGSDTHESLWQMLGQQAGKTLSVRVALVDEEPFAVFSSKPLLDADLQEWAAAMALECEDGPERVTLFTPDGSED